MLPRQPVGGQAHELSEPLKIGQRAAVTGAPTASSRPAEDLSTLFDTGEEEIAIS